MPLNTHGEHANTVKHTLQAHLGTPYKSCKSPYKSIRTHNVQTPYIFLGTPYKLFWEHLSTPSNHIIIHLNTQCAHLISMGHTLYAIQKSPYKSVKQTLWAREHHSTHLISPSITPLNTQLITPLKQPLNTPYQSLNTPCVHMNTVKQTSQVLWAHLICPPHAHYTSVKHTMWPRDHS